MMRTALLLALAGGALLLSSGGVRAETIRCESTGGAYRACSADTRGGVRLSRQLSSQGCWQNDTWGYDLNRIWVDRGCRAEFSVGGSSSSSGKDNAVAGAIVLGLVGAAIIASNKDRDRRDDYRYDDRYDDRYGRPGRGDPRGTIRCESNDNRFSYCNVPYRGHVEIYRQMSSAPCVYGRSWGQERGGRIWVAKGCRAEFAVY
jgi:Protein of unknown function (DUF3011)